MKNFSLIVSVAALIIIFFLVILPLAFNFWGISPSIQASSYCRDFMYLYHESHSYGADKFEISLFNGNADVVIREISINSVRAAKIETSLATVPSGSKFRITADFPGLGLDKTQPYNLRLVYDTNGTIGNQEFAVCAG